MKALFGIILGLILSLSCSDKKGIAPVTPAKEIDDPIPDIALTVLGVVQDAGRPHIGCQRSCCMPENQTSGKQYVVSLGLSDRKNNRTYLIEATPDIAAQLKNFSNQISSGGFRLPDGIFLTHAHIGHYSGLMFLGREGLGADRVPVYAMPGMTRFIQDNGPWGQLVALENIILRSLQEENEVILTPQLSITPIEVPHRDEYSETVGFIIQGPNKKVLFIPDINKWHLWDRSIVALLAEVDLAFLDGSFYNGDELPFRDMTEIPHPFIVESMILFDPLPESERKKIHFIHLNHTNPLLNDTSEAYSEVLSKGYKVARQGHVFEL